MFLICKHTWFWQIRARMIRSIILHWFLNTGIQLTKGNSTVKSWGSSYFYSLVGLFRFKNQTSFFITRKVYRQYLWGNRRDEIDFYIISLNYNF